MKKKYFKADDQRTLTLSNSLKKIAKLTGRSALQVNDASLANNSFNKIVLITKKYHRMKHLSNLIL